MIVLDASVVVKWLTPEPGHAAAKAFVGRDLIAPALVRVEVASALVKMCLRGDLSADDLAGAFQLWFGRLAEGLWHGRRARPGNRRRSLAANPLPGPLLEGEGERQRPEVA